MIKQFSRRDEKRLESKSVGTEGCTVPALFYIYIKKDFPFTKFSPTSFKLRSSRTKGGEKMNTKMKKTFFWGALFTPIVLGIYFLVGGNSALAAGPHGHGHGPGGMGPRGALKVII
jgi:hypothetical protein